MPIFHPHPQVRVLPISPTQQALVIDDALVDPAEWIAFAQARRPEFVQAPHNAYPGIELGMPNEFCWQLDEFFTVHVRNRLGGRRNVGMNSRMAMVTLPPSQLQPRQWMCHRDSAGLPPHLLIVASVLYLFGDERLGGTSIYRPRRSADETALLVHESGTLDGDAFARKYGARQGYLLDSNDWFERVLTIEPRFNRMVFYDGNLFHTSHLPEPALLTDDPRTGRLTINGFFTGTRRQG